MLLMEEADDRERHTIVSQAFVETNKHFNEAFNISRYFQFYIPTTVTWFVIV